MAKKQKEVTETVPEVPEQPKPIPVELIGIALILFPDYKGPRIERAIRLGDQKHKFDASIPAPRDPEQIKEIYNVTKEEIWNDGYRQRSYDTDGAVRNIIKEQMAKGVPPEDFAELVRTNWEEAMKFDPEKAKSKGGVAKKERAEGKKAQAAAQETGFASVDEMIEFAKRAKAAEAV